MTSVITSESHHFSFTHIYGKQCFHGISILQASFANEKIRILKTKARPTFSTENYRINRCGSLVLVEVVFFGT